MANYNYDEGGVMASYFIISFLVLVLIPSTFSTLSPQKKEKLDGCQCTPCVEQRKRNDAREKGSLLNPKFSTRSLLLVAGWTALGFLTYQATQIKLEHKVYNPFEILGISTGLSQKDIKTHFKKLSRTFHPDKVQLAVNQTLEEVQNKFVEITKAYKSLTDETIRTNWEVYGHPDGRQETSMGIALPKWIIEGKNNIWVLGFYGLVFGGALPILVGRWWFGNREKTKDGVNAKSAAAFFKTLKEEANADEVVGTLGKAYQWERQVSAKVDQDLDALEKEIAAKAQLSWSTAKGFIEKEPARRRGLVLIYAHLLRLPLANPLLVKEQSRVLLQTPLLLNALVNISVSRNWLHTTLWVMRLQAYLVQALLPGSEKLQFTQFPGVKSEELADLSPDVKDVTDLVSALEKKHDSRVSDIKKAADKWGRLELVDVSFKVIGERVVVPSSIVFLLVKLRITPPTASKVEQKELSVDETKRLIKRNEEKDHQFLISRKETEDLPENAIPSGYAHAPFWPANRKPSWWIVLADDKSGRVVVPPMKISDVPFANPKEDRDYRSYKLQFQAPPNTGLFTWKIYIVSDSFVGEEISRDIVLKIDDASVLAAEDQPEDDISDPDEDTLAGQMAAMRGGAVKKHVESDDESTTDDDQKEEESSDSDSD
ncbi:hypothetical protein BDN72DRAFT_799683 [Pluteus cervinus]|uniref:Uncharacterized protein n=1 Tax=Pluteus cervinus TaxID=181527 RepID=A0ACD3AL49_9AGAR|nr:hypothetical protein BDN72DRAFT_799683 [Pluteus cervinus]